MQTRFPLLLALLLATSIETGRGADSFFPLMAWNWAPSDAATFEQIRDCGLTVAGFVSPKELDLCHAAGLKAIDQFGHATPTWAAMQNVNLQVHKLAPALLQLTSDEVYHFGALPEGAHGPGESSLVATVGNAPFMVGDFTHADGSRYALVVNKDSLRSHHGAVTFRQKPGRVQMVSPYTGQLTAFAGEQQWLAAGQGILLKVE